MAELPSGTVTFLFTDLEGSTRLWEERPDAMRSALARHDVILRESVAARGGHIVKTTGDGVHAAFATAHDALDAAVAAQQELAAGSWGDIGPLKVRMGLHTCEAEVRDGDYFGSAVNRAARLMSVAHGGQVVMSAATCEIVRGSDVEFVDLGEHRLRDLARAERVFQVVVPGLPAEFPALRSLDAFASNLPSQLTSFIGRDDDLLAVAKELSESRLVTLIGVGGVGKTRLGLQVAGELLPRFPDGAWFCELATVDDADAMLQVVAATLGVQGRPGASLEESIVDFLVSKHLLLVLDNCEHLLRAVGRLVLGILRECPNIYVLATSREGLGVSGEQLWPVSSLEIPESGELVEIGGSASVRLFADRAHAVRPGFALNDGNMDAVAEICRRLDGIPLAIELAAARVSVMSPQEISALLDERFRLLKGGRHSAVERHQTLRATVDWSYSLLEPRERIVFDRLGVFAGSFDARAAQSVVAGSGVDGWDVLDALNELVTKSMLATEETLDGTTRYQLLETLRQYARERLDESGEIDEWRRRHAEHFATLIEEIAPAMQGPDELVWKQRLFTDLDNVRAAITWSLESDGPGDVEYAMRIIAMGFDLNLYRSFVVGEWLEPAVSRADETTPARRAVVLAQASGWVAHSKGDLDTAEVLAHDALRDGVPVDAPWATVAHTTLSIIAMQRGDIRAARDWLSEGQRALGVTSDNDYQRSILHQIAAMWALLDHDTDAAQQDAAAGLVIARRLGNPSRIAAATLAHGRVLEDTGNLDAALASFEESMALIRAGAAENSVCTLLARIARIRTAKGDVTAALAALSEAVRYIQDVGLRSDFVSAVTQASRTLAELDGYAATAATLAGAVVNGALANLGAAGSRERVDRGLHHVRAQLGDAAYEQAFAYGATLTYHEMVTFLAAELDRATTSIATTR